MHKPEAINKTPLLRVRYWSFRTELGISKRKRTALGFKALFYDPDGTGPSFQVVMVKSAWLTLALKDRVAFNPLIWPVKYFLLLISRSFSRPDGKCISPPHSMYGLGTRRNGPHGPQFKQDVSIKR